MKYPYIRKVEWVPAIHMYGAIAHGDVIKPPAGVPWTSVRIDGYATVEASDSTQTGTRLWTTTVRLRLCPGAQTGRFGQVVGCYRLTDVSGQRWILGKYGRPYPRTENGLQLAAPTDPASRSLTITWVAPWGLLREIN